MLGSVRNGNSKIKRIVLNGLMIALVFLVTYFTKIPGPVGYFNLGDVAIIIAAVILGKYSGFIAGAFGSALADIFVGFAFFAPVTFLVKGLEGFLTGYIIHSLGSRLKIREGVTRIIAIVAGCTFMVMGYFLAETYILSVVSSEYGLAQALTELPTNVVQGVVSIVAGYAITTQLLKIRAVKRIAAEAASKE